MTVRISNLLFGTQPIAAHCPGPLHDRWRHFVDAVMNQPSRKCDSSEVTVFTWNTGSRPRRPTKPCGVFESSAANLGIDVLVLGAGMEAWKNRDKFACAAEALQRVTTPYVLGADSADVVLLDSPQMAVDRFRRHFSCKLLFNATGSRCWPELPELVRFQQSLPMARLVQGRHWINSGLLIGETAFCRDYFSQLAESEPVPGYESSDQAVVMQTWPDWYPQVQADYLSQVFQWFNEEPDVMRVERPLVSRQRQLLEWLRRLPRPQRGAEIGVFRGDTSEALLREIPDLELWLVDPWRPYGGASRVGEGSQQSFDQAMAAALFWTEFARHRRFILREPSTFAATRFDQAELDFVFVDANHTYEHVCADIKAWWPKVRPGGLLMGHDYGVYGDATGQWGVRRAVDEFVTATDRELILGSDGTWCVTR